MYRTNTDLHVNPWEIHHPLCPFLQPRCSVRHGRHLQWRGGGSQWPRWGEEAALAGAGGTGALAEWKGFPPGRAPSHSAADQRGGGVSGVGRGQRGRGGRQETGSRCGLSRFLHCGLILSSKTVSPSFLITLSPTNSAPTHESCCDSAKEWRWKLFWKLKLITLETWVQACRLQPGDDSACTCSGKSRLCRTWAPPLQAAQSWLHARSHSWVDAADTICSTNAEATTGPFTDSLPAHLRERLHLQSSYGMSYMELEKESVYSINLVITIKKD